MTYTPEFIEYLRDCFTDNEAGSDEYRETAPAKAASYFEAGISEASPEVSEKISELFNAWKAEVGPLCGFDFEREGGISYVGAELYGEACPLLFDAMFADGKGEHPYYGHDLAWEEEDYEESTGLSPFIKEA
jgi:hypothetical protein